VQDSVEDQMARRIAKKLYLASRVMGVADGGNMVNHAAATATASALATPALSSSGSTSSSKAPSPAPAAPTPEDEVVSVNVHELLDILRGGSAALAAKWSGSGESAYDAFAKADIDELLARSQQIEGRRGAKLECVGGDARWCRTELTCPPQSRCGRDGGDRTGGRADTRGPPATRPRGRGRGATALAGYRARRDSAL
jgi:hypothetical protein